MRLKRAGYTYEEPSSCVKDRLQDSGERPQQQESQKGEMQNKRTQPRECNDWFLHVFIYVYMCVQSACGVWRSEDNFRESVLSYSVGSEDSTQVAGFSGKYLYH